MNQYFNVIINKTTADGKHGAYHGVVSENNVVSISNYNSKGHYTATDFESETEAYKATLHILQNKKELIESNPSFKNSSEIAIEIRCESLHSTKVLYSVSIK